MSLTGYDWNRLERALRKRYGLSRDWTIERGIAGPHYYWVTLLGPEAKRIKCRGWIADQIPTNKDRPS